MQSFRKNSFKSSYPQSNGWQEEKRGSLNGLKVQCFCKKFNYFSLALANIILVDFTCLLKSIFALFDE